MAAAGLETQQKAELEAATDDALATSAIEGETLLPASVRSSIARRLGLPGGGVAPQDSQVEGVAEVVLDATHDWRMPLTEERLFDWHHALFPTPQKGLDPIEVGRWRTDAQGPMQVVSAVYRGGKPPRIHFEAPPTFRVPGEMAGFLDWFNANSADTDGLVRAGIAHLWFVTIHPLDDGNGRIGRAIADKAIAQAEGSGRRFYSLSSAILRRRRSYYEALERVQKGDLDVTEWLIWFLECHMEAVGQAERTAKRVIAVSRFWSDLDAARTPINERQRKVLAKLVEGWEGLMTTRKWSAICGCSPDTAQRDMADLVARGLLVPTAAGGRSTGYIFEMPGAG
jgi:Fic family protein